MAADGKSARAVYISPGIETDVFHDKPGFENVRDELGLEDGKACGKWAWKKYAFEFVLEDGEWKIWHFRQYALIKTPYDRPWTQILPFPPGAYCDNHASRVREDARWFYTAETVYPDYDPDPPKAYENLDKLGDVVPFMVD